GLAIWSHLAVGWRWSAPDSPVMIYGMILMLIAMVYFLLLLCIASVPVAWSAIHGIIRNPRPGRVMPALLALASAAVLIPGSNQFLSAWPGAGGKPWSGQAMVPSGIASYIWAMTLGITSYWRHPQALHSFPHRELIWMAVSPAIIIAFITGCALLARQARV